MGRRGEARTQVIQVDEASSFGEYMIVLQQEQGENLMFRRVLLKPKKKAMKELEQRKKVFKAKRKVRGKSCNLIIDVGITKNLVSTEVMEKLKLKSLVHPSPY